MPSSKMAEGDPLIEMLRWPRMNAAPFPTRGHLPAQQVDVRANDAASSAYAALVQDTVFAEGASLLESPHAAAGPAYSMRKGANGWKYTELDAQGGVTQSGAVAWCAACHAQAPSDHVFGVPRPPE